MISIPNEPLPLKRTCIRVLLIIVMAGFSVITGCSDEHRIKIGDIPPEISGNDIQGRPISLSKLRDKVVILCFWTTSCCGDILTRLQPFQSNSKDKGLTVLAVNVGNSKETVESYAKDYALTFTLLTDTNSKLFKQYQIVGFPTIFIIDRNGIVREKIMGDIQTENLLKLVVKQFKIQKEIETNYNKAHNK
jgi:peroxiredoxin